MNLTALILIHIADATHPEELQELMRKGHYDAGFAFDGDADLLLPVDEDGNLINGGYTLYIVVRH